MSKLKYKYIAIDFDGTITHYAPHPELGEIREEAVRVIKRIRDEGGKICIWTCRCDDDEQRVIDYLARHGIEYDIFNEPFEDMCSFFGGNPRKVCAEIYIDDKSLHCEEIDWLDIEQRLFL